jgi:hypothetical protein
MNVALTTVRRIWAAALAVLRFLNLLEPGGDSPKVSITKAGQWLAYGLLTYMVLNHPDDPGGIAVALAGVITSTGASVFRRHYQYKGGMDPYDNELKGSADVDDPDNSDDK